MLINDVGTIYTDIDQKEEVNGRETESILQIETV